MCAHNQAQLVVLVNFRNPVSQAAVTMESVTKMEANANQRRNSGWVF